MAGDGPANIYEWMADNASALVLEQLTAWGAPPKPWPVWQERLFDQYVARVRLACLSKAAERPIQEESPLAPAVATAFWSLRRDGRNTEAENVANVADSLNVPTGDMQAWLDNETQQLTHLREENPKLYEARLAAIRAVADVLTEGITADGMVARIFPNPHRKPPAPDREWTDEELKALA